MDTLAKLVISILAMAMFGCVSAWCLWKGASEATQQMILTALVAWCGGVMGYYLGSSAGSSAKDKTIASTVPPAKDPTL